MEIFHGIRQKQFKAIHLTTNSNENIFQNIYSQSPLFFRYQLKNLNSKDMIHDDQK